jgi:putative membrane protein
MKYDDLNANEKMASLRTSLSVQRTRMAAERTLMATLRTSLSLIGFGFTIFSFFQGLSSLEAGTRTGIVPPRAPARFGLALVFIGVLVLLLGTVYHYQYMVQLRRQRKEFIAQGYLPGTSSFPISMSLVTAFLLLLVGLAAILSIMLRAGPFS